ncbi:prepilin-type N-terminal cleavage/methylation domain-containing protein [Enterovibrio sp. ZSDZ35]|uniref:Prepilin-type N-terminal cleavage/methylation domain-containing protein n=1 Tax=Enterovibrio qingdaonensis TaxID=2899818 RepID=A0ABT5QTT6_9GAMM|nr:prepilin-type N-terminal cleavage/methylation domain-containing protein [Enterovibrio sp. ZSDZ35]MDD1784324.1 prepilin-type N-terminal cleavage/methylation domain-containing protein [Enterovibrio sp. ZSDZ35]
MRYWNLQRGFSLIEMIVAVSVLAVVTAVAVPSFVNSQKTASVESRSAKLLTVLEVGQTESVKRHREIYVYYKPVKDGNDGCIGLSEKPNKNDFTCLNNEGLQKLLFTSDDSITVQAPVVTETTKLFYFSSVNGLPSSNKTVKLAFGSETGDESGVMIRQYTGLKGCSNTSYRGWEACPS